MDLRLTTFPTTSSQISSHAHLPVPVISRLGLVIWSYHNLFFLSLGCCSTCIAWASRLAEASDRLIWLLDILHYQSLWGSSISSNHVHVTSCYFSALCSVFLGLGSPPRATVWPAVRAAGMCKAQSNDLAAPIPKAPPRHSKDARPPDTAIHLPEDHGSRYLVIYRWNIAGV